MNQTEQILADIRMFSEATSTSNNSSNSSLTSIANSSNSIEEYQTYSVWDKIPGNSTVFSYYGASAQGSDPNNPSGNAGNVATKQYLTGATVILTQTFTYTGADEIQSITAS